MRNRLSYFRAILDYLGLLCWVSGVLMLVPLAVRLTYAQAGREEVSVTTFWVPAGVAFALGLLLKRNWRFPPLDNRRAMVLCALGWIVVSAVGALPFVIGLKVSFLDAYFETVSGYTTTGITMLRGLDGLPASILFWRGFIQWLGGLGILTFFLAVLYTGGSAHRLFSAESHKVFSKRPAPGLLHSLRILWLIYVLFTAAVALALTLEGVGVFDAVCHAMTTLSTGGYSPHDASIGFYRQTGHPHFVLVEYTVIAGMILGGMNFFVHYRWLRGGFRALWDSAEMRLWWAVLLGATLLVMVDGLRQPSSGGWDRLHDLFRTSLFQVTSIVTTTGYATADIAGSGFGATAKLVLLVLMVVGGCVGSTGGGIKVLRIAVLFRMVSRQVRHLIYGPSSVQCVTVDGEMVSTEELRRIAALFFAWMGLLVFGAVVTALLSDLGALSAASGMFSALGNVGPCYIPNPDMTALHPLVKIVYILGMLAGRLEILPVLLLFSRRTWR
ncbi:MAG TPA: TrkH family potassium uptake protein [Planctomycetota bacterium]|nr:TrkH family potassium uptake protein [Planctomycetota bacterium]